MRKHIAEPLIAAGLIVATLVGVALAGTASAQAAQTRVTYVQHKAEPVPADAQPCAYEDGSGGQLPCYWDARQAGNGVGQSFWIDRRDRTHYLSNRLDFIQRQRERSRVRVGDRGACFARVGSAHVYCFTR